MLIYIRTFYTKSFSFYRSFVKGMQIKPREKVCEKCTIRRSFRTSKKDIIKPERSHHCSKCSSCNIKMDHHCGFLFSCVSFNNHRYFCQLILYGTISAVFCMSQFLIFFTIKFKDIYNNSTYYDLILKILGYWFMFVMMLVYGCGCISLLVYHLKMAAFNLTTIEDIDRKEDSVYDLGMLYNLKGFLEVLFIFSFLLAENRNMKGITFRKRVLILNSV